MPPSTKQQVRRKPFVSGEAANGAKDATNGAKGTATRNKDATRGSWPYY